MPSVEDPQDLLHLPDNLRPRKVRLVGVWWSSAGPWNCGGGMEAQAVRLRPHS